PVLDRGDEFLGCPTVVGVIGLAAAGQGDHRRVMEVVIPKRVESVTAAIDGPNDPWMLRLVFTDDDDGPAASRRPGPAADLGEDVFRRVWVVVVDGLRGVESQPVEVELVDPIGGV